MKTNNFKKNTGTRRSNHFSHFAGILAVLVVFAGLMANTCITSVYAAVTLPSFSRQAYAETKAIKDIPVYKDTSLSQRGTISPSKVYSARVDKGDTIKIESVNGSVAVISYPTPSGWRRGAVRTGDILLRPSPVEGGHSKGRVTVYPNEYSSTAYGTVFVNDVAFSYGSRNGRTQLLYEAKSGNRSFKIGWVPTNVFESQVKGVNKSSSSNTASKGQSQTQSGRVITNSSYNTTVSDKARESRPHYINRSGSRGADAYNKVIDQFNVTSNGRYRRTAKYTYCNIFAWDVMSAMNVSLPHWVISSTGAPASSYAKGASELTANATYNWLQKYGARYGWYKVSAQNAQTRANRGYPTIAIWKNPSGASGHVAVVRPETSAYKYSSNNPVIAQAGATNYKITKASKGFGSNRLSSIVYWTHD